jgi:hypothetical protein
MEPDKIFCPGGSRQPVEKAHFGQGNPRKSKPFFFDFLGPDLAGLCKIWIWLRRPDPGDIFSRRSLFGVKGLEPGENVSLRRLGSAETPAGDGDEAAQRVRRRPGEDPVLTCVFAGLVRPTMTRPGAPASPCMKTIPIFSAACDGVPVARVTHKAIGARSRRAMWPNLQAAAFISIGDYSLTAPVRLET